MEREERKGRRMKNRERGEQREKGGEKRGNLLGLRKVSRLSFVLYYVGSKSD
jgi:hypothetical protein